MRSGHRRALPVAWALWLVAASGTLPPRVTEGAEDRERAVLVDPGDPTLVARVRGQSADLPFALSVAETAAPVAASLPAAEEVSQREGAAVIIWFEKVPAGFMVYVADIRRGELLARRVTAAASKDDLSESALAEAAALVVRSALVSVSRGDTLETAPRESTEEPPARPAVARGPEEPGIHAPEEASLGPEAPTDHGPVERTPRRSSMEASVGYEVGADLADAPLHQAPAALLAYRSASVRLGLALAYGLPRDLEDERTRVTLSRHRVNVGAGYALTTWERAELWGELAFGALVYPRRTEALAPGVVAARPSNPVVPNASAGLGLTWFPGPSPLGVSFRAGADVLLARVRLRYEASGGGIQRAALWPLSPYIGVAATIRSGAF